MFKPLLDYTKELLGKKVEKVQISKHLVNSPVVVLSADYGWTAQMEKVMKSQAFADQSKFEFMKSKRMCATNPSNLANPITLTLTLTLTLTVPLTPTLTPTLTLTLTLALALTLTRFEINPRHPMIIELNSRIKDNAADDTTKVQPEPELTPNPNPN